MAQRNNTPGKEDWYTPGYIIRACEKVFSIPNFDFDPCSSAEANKTVRATTYLTKEQDGLTTEWSEWAYVWMNPPYTRGLVGKFVEKFLSLNSPGAVLINSTTETKAWQALAREATYIWFPDRRIAFISDGQPVKGNTLPQTLFLFGWSDEMNVDHLWNLGGVVVQGGGL
jgi:hypothetical protein